MINKNYNNKRLEDGNKTLLQIIWNKVYFIFFFLSQSLCVLFIITFYLD